MCVCVYVDLHERLLSTKISQIVNFELTKNKIELPPFLLLHCNVLLYFYISISICTFDSIAIIDLPRPFPIYVPSSPLKLVLCAAIEALHCKQDLHKFSIFYFTFSSETEVKSNPVDLLNGKKDLNTVQTIFSIIFAKVILSFPIPIDELINDSVHFVDESN